MTVEPVYRCSGCMDPRSGNVCPTCGWIEGTPPESPNFLPPGTCLRGEYILGRVLGAGGFGITYLAWDSNLNLKLAIKEYFPTAFGTRSHDRQTVVVHNSESKEAFEHGQRRFLAEGQALAKFRHPGIVSVLTFFRQNGTSYLVMHYEDGITLAGYISQQAARRISEREAIQLITPVMDALREVHAAGLLHRDISPDNIIINTSGQVKLLDFGSAKHQLAAQTHSEMLTLKRGYSPEEQYRTNGEQGFWTDVYSLAATIYFTITGQKPPDALDRLAKETLEPPSKSGVEVSRKFESALMKGLETRAPKRFQTVAEFQAALGTPSADPKKINSNPKFSAWVGGTCLVLGIVALVFYLLSAPDIQLFNIEPSRITVGQSAKMHWSVRGGHIEITPGTSASSTASSGETQISPQSTTTYTLTVRGSLGRSASRSAALYVKPLGHAVTLMADPTIITAGQSSELTWNVDGKPQAVSIQPGIGSVPSSGRYKISPLTTTTYKLLVTNIDGTRSESSALVSVQASATAPKPVISLNVNPPAIDAGETATLTWSVAGEGVSVKLDGIGPVKARGALTVSPASTTSYKLTARNSGGTDSKTVLLSVAEVPKIVSFSANPQTISRGQSSTLEWSTEGAVQSVTLDGLGSVSHSGSQVVSPPGSTTYLLAVTGAGHSVTRSVTVSVIVPRKPPEITTFSSSPAVVNPGQPVLLRWSATGDLNEVSINNGIGRVDAIGSVIVKPTVPTTYLLTAQGPAGEASKSLSVGISNVEFSIGRFAAKPGKIKQGQTAELSWLVTGPVTALSISPGFDVLKTKQGIVEVRPSATTIYTITAWAGSRRLVQTATVKVK